MKVSYKSIVWLLMGMIKHSQSFQNRKLAMSLQYLKKKKLDMKFIFCMQINIKVSLSWFQHFWHQSFLQADTIIIDGHALKVTSLQYLIKEVGDGVQYVDKHQSFSSCHCWVKKCCNYFCVLLWCKTFRYLWGFSHICYLFI